MYVTVRRSNQGYRFAWFWECVLLDKGSVSPAGSRYQWSGDGVGKRFIVTGDGIDGINHLVR